MNVPIIRRPVQPVPYTIASPDVENILPYKCESKFPKDCVWSSVHSEPFPAMFRCRLFLSICHVPVLCCPVIRVCRHTHRSGLLRSRASYSRLQKPGRGSACPSTRRSRCRCAQCIRRCCCRPRPFRCRHSIHAVPNLLGRLGWARRHLLRRTAREACSDLRGGSCPTNQYIVQINVLANVTATNETVTGTRRGSNLLRGIWRGRSSGLPSSSRSRERSWRREYPRH
jgi:hypothetical protein